MSAPRMVPSILVLIAFLLAGCTMPGGDVGRAFETIDAPVWESGYSWTYDVVASTQSSGFGREGLGTDGGSERTTVTVKVINTTKEAEGEPVYIVEIDGGFDSPIFDGDVQALTKRDLEVAAVGYHGAFDMSPRGHDPCMGQAPLYPVEPGERFPGLRFPLDDGTSERGTIGFEDTFGMTYTMKVHGLVDVETLAGPFKAVYVTTDFSPTELPDDAPAEFGAYDLSLRSELWYSPDARYLVKQVFTASASATEGGERYQFAYRTTAILSDYSLEAGPELEGPEIAAPQPPVATPYFPARIVSDTAFPVNIADGPVAAQFMLEHAGGRGRYVDATIHQVSDFDPITFDNATHEIVWTVRTYQDGRIDETMETGDVLNLELARGGGYEIRAQVAPKECGASVLADGFGSVATFWSRTYSFETDTGDLPQTIELDSVPVEENPREATVSWIRQPKIGYSPDNGNILIRGPDGRAQTFQGGPSGQASFDPYPPGSYSLSWQTSGLPSFGEDIEVTVTVTYGNLW